MTRADQPMTEIKRWRREQRGRAAERVGEREEAIPRPRPCPPDVTRTSVSWSQREQNQDVCGPSLRSGSGVVADGPLIPSYSIKGMRIITKWVQVDDVTGWISG